MLPFSLTQKIIHSATDIYFYITHIVWINDAYSHNSCLFTLFTLPKLDWDQPEWVEGILQSASRGIGAAPIGSVTWCLKIRHPKISGVEFFHDLRIYFMDRTPTFFLTPHPRQLFFHRYLRWVTTDIHATRLVAVCRRSLTRQGGGVVRVMAWDAQADISPMQKRMKHLNCCDFPGLHEVDCKVNLFRTCSTSVYIYTYIHMYIMYIYICTYIYHFLEMWFQNLAVQHRRPLATLVIRWANLFSMKISCAAAVCFWTVPVCCKDENRTNPKPNPTCFLHNFAQNYEIHRSDICFFWHLALIRRPFGVSKFLALPPQCCLPGMVAEIPPNPRLSAVEASKGLHNMTSWYIMDDVDFEWENTYIYSI